MLGTIIIAMPLVTCRCINYLYTNAMVTKRHKTKLLLIDFKKRLSERVVPIKFKSHSSHYIPTYYSVCITYT